VAGLLGAPLDSLIEAVLLGSGGSVLFGSGHGYSRMNVLWKMCVGEQGSGASALLIYKFSGYLEVPWMARATPPARCNVRVDRPSPPLGWVVVELGRGAVPGQRSDRGGGRDRAL
jgi:hypothetical protein